LVALTFSVVSAVISSYVLYVVLNRQKKFNDYVKLELNSYTKLCDQVSLLEKIKDAVFLFQKDIESLKTRMDEAEELKPILQQISKAFEDVHMLKDCVVVGEMLTPDDVSSIKNDVNELNTWKNQLEGDGK
jgi:hypothetical protein